MLQINKNFGKMVNRQRKRDRRIEREGGSERKGVR